MGPGILTRYSKQVLGGLLAAFAIIAAVLLYFGSAVQCVAFHHTNISMPGEKSESWSPQNSRCMIRRQKRSR